MTLPVTNADEDIVYLKEKLIKLTVGGASEEKILKCRAQLDLLEDAMVIYHENRPASE